MGIDNRRLAYGIAGAEEKSWLRWFIRLMSDFSRSSPRDVFGLGEWGKEVDAIEMIY